MVQGRAFRFGVTAPRATSGQNWRTFSRKAEDLGYATLVVPDHFGDQFAPMVGLAAAFDATTTLRGGLLVACNDYRHPVLHAKELATLDVLSMGRVEWGVGAGWLADEYQRAGIGFDRAAVRVGRMQESVIVMKRLFHNGAVSYDGQHYQLRGLEGLPKPVQRPHPPLLVGAAGERLLSFAAREADIVGIAPSLTARMIGTQPPVETVEAAADRQLGRVRSVARSRFDRIEIHMVASPVIATRDREQRAAGLADRLGLVPGEVLVSPHVWLGTLDQICESLLERRERWAVSYWTVPANALDTAAPVVGRLAGT